MAELFLFNLYPFEFQRDIKTSTAQIVYETCNSLVSGFHCVIEFQNCPSQCTGLFEIWYLAIFR